jgi:predicted O-methyltransferase YrrM
MIYPWDVPSSVTYQECAVLDQLATGCEHVLEVGSWLGRSTIILANAAAHVTAVDWHQGDFHSGPGGTEERFRANLVRYGVLNVEVFIGRIEEVAPVLPSDYDGVFIDAAHDAESVAAHWLVATDLVRPGGWVAFHDYGRFGVTEILDELNRVWDLTESLAVTRIEP